MTKEEVSLHHLLCDLVALGDLAFQRLPAENDKHKHIHVTFCKHRYDIKLFTGRYQIKHIQVVLSISLSRHNLVENKSLVLEGSDCLGLCVPSLRALRLFQVLLTLLCAPKSKNCFLKIFLEKKLFVYITVWFCLISCTN